MFITELVNRTDKTISFEFVDDGKRDSRRYRPLKAVPPNKTKNITTGLIVGAFSFDDLQWEIRVLMDGKFTGKKIPALAFIDCMRIVFSTYVEHDLVHLSVQGALNWNYMEMFARFRGIGRLFGRKRFDKIPLEEIATEEKLIETKVDDKRVSDDKQPILIKIILTNNNVAATQELDQEEEEEDVKKLIKILINNNVAATQELDQGEEEDVKKEKPLIDIDTEEEEEEEEEARVSVDLINLFSEKLRSEVIENRHIPTTYSLMDM